MPKKHQYRASAQEKKERQEALRKEKNAAFWAKYKMPVIIGAAALVILIVAIVLIINAASAKGSLKVVDGKVEGLQENWLVDNLGTEKRPRYFKIAEVNVPEGYKNLGKVVNDTVEQNFMLAGMDEDTLMEQVLIMNMPGKDAADMAAAMNESTQGMLYVLEAQEPVHTTIAGKDVHYRVLTCADMKYDADGQPVAALGIYQAIGAYTDLKDNNCLMVYMTTKTFAPKAAEGEEDKVYTPEDLLPTEEDLMDAMEELFAGIVIE